MFAEQGIRLAHAQVDSGTDQRAPDQQQTFNEQDTRLERMAQAIGARQPARSPGPGTRRATNRLLDAWA